MNCELYHDILVTLLGQSSIDSIIVAWANDNVCFLVLSEVNIRFSDRDLRARKLYPTYKTHASLRVV
jgi:hypothetical protein